MTGQSHNLLVTWTKRHRTYKQIYLNWKVLLVEVQRWEQSRRVSGIGDWRDKMTGQEATCWKKMFYKKKRKKMFLVPDILIFGLVPFCFPSIFCLLFLHGFYLNKYLFTSLSLWTQSILRGFHSLWWLGSVWRHWWNS